MTVRLGTKLIANTSSGGTGDTNVLVDNITITKDENDIITTVAIDNKNNSSNIPAVKTWMGTLAEYEAIENKSNDVIYYITDDETLAQSANVSLSNLSEEGEKHFLNKSQITNCLLEVPQRVKLELNNGILTLKAGSELTYGDGRTIVIENDIVQTCQVNATFNNLILIHELGTNGFGVYIQGANATSGTTPPPIATGMVDYIWFDTNTNQMKISHDTQATWKEIPLPIGVVDITPNTFTAIKQIFNGFGYIGSTVWVDKGIKGLISNGRNEDRTLKNIEVTTQEKSVITQSGTYNRRIFLNSDGSIQITGNSYNYNFDENLVYVNSVLRKAACIGEVNMTDNVITSFQPKLPFRAVDYNDYTKDLDTKVNKSGDTMTGDLTIQKNSKPLFVLQNNTDDRDVAPSTSAGTAYVALTDKNNNTIVQFANERLTSGTNTAKLQAFGKGGSNAPAIRVSAYADGRQGCSFPMCTTKATTTSSARSDLIAVVTQNYVNGTSWYRVWSDGWIEQGGAHSKGTAVKISLMKNFSNTNYTIQLTAEGSANAWPPLYNSKTTSSFTVRSSAEGTFAGNWRACGY